MNQSDSPANTPKRIRSRGMMNHGLSQTAFSAMWGRSTAQGKMYALPMKMRMRRRNASGRNATYPSRKRITDRDHRAVVIRCAATNMTPADDTVVKYNQL